MDFSLNEEQQLLADSAQKFVARESSVERARKLRDDAVGWERSTWQQMCELGWLMAAFPDDVGGFGSFLEASLILEQLGRNLVPEPYSTCLVAGVAIHRAGSPEQHSAWLEPLMAGEIVATLALAPRRTGQASASAVREADGWRVKADGVWALDGHAADLVIIDGGDAGFFVLDRAAVEVRPVATIDGRRAGLLQGVDVHVGEDRRLAGASAEVRELVLDVAAACTVAEGAGALRRSLELTLQHLNDRKQFGVAIGSFQALQHRAVDMFVEVELLVSISLEATLRIDEEDAAARRKAVSAAKVQLATGARWASQETIQLHGGIGVTDEHDIGLYFKRLHALSVMFGDEDHHTARYAAESDLLDVS